MSELLRPERMVYFGAVPAVAGGVVLAVSAVTTQLPALPRGLAIGALVLSLMGGFLFKRREVRTHASIGAATVAVAFAGQTRTGEPYIVAAWLFAVVALVCFRAPLIAGRIQAAREQAGRGMKMTLAVDRRPVAIAVLCAVAAAFTTFFVVSLPPAGDYVEREVQRLAGNNVAEDDRVGFATSLRVGSLHNMLLSDRVVMRIDGEKVDYLRGVALDRYDSRVWSETRAKTLEPMATNASLDDATVHIELSRAALSARTGDPRWFLPHDACDVHTPSGHMNVDVHGGAHPDPPNDAREISFRLASKGPCKSTLPAPSPPTAQDLGMAKKIRDELLPIAQRWTAGATTKAEQLEAIFRELQRYTYSLEDRRETWNDPVFDFLTVTKSGHCELFASALALLARTLGIPTRLVAGYRVDEVNPITGRGVVRDRNAHTWVEAWNGEAWVAMDPTPASELLARARPSRWEQASEAASYGWDRTVGFFAQIGLARTGIFSGVVAVVLILVRRYMRRGLRSATKSSAAARPLPAFETLSGALARAGWVRTESEPLERFARRVESGGEPWSAEVAEALARYAELRYGGIGEEKTVASRLEQLARQVAPA